MRYQNPSIERSLEHLRKKGVSEIIIFPLFPQYASATTGSVFEEVMGIMKKKELIPSIKMINSYYDHPEAFGIAKELDIPADKMTVSYQSRFGPEAWLQPYTDYVLKEQLEKGHKNILCFSPAFVADCLETTIEIGEEYKEDFMEEGGERLDLVESLNDDHRWMQIIADIVSDKAA